MFGACKFKLNNFCFCLFYITMFLIYAKPRRFQHSLFCILALNVILCFMVMLCVGLHFTPLLVSLLDNGQFRVRIGHGQVAVGRVPGAVQHQSPFLDETGLDAIWVESNLKKEIMSQRAALIGINVCTNIHHYYVHW